MRLSAMLLGLCLAGAAPVGAQEARAWYVRGQMGVADNHGQRDWQIWGEGRIGRAFGENRVVSVDVGVASSKTDDGFTTGTVGIEVLPWPRKRASLFLRAEVGLLGESDFVGLVAGAGGGLAVRIGPRMRFRAGATFNFHDFVVSGPVQVYGAFEFRF